MNVLMNKFLNFKEGFHEFGPSVIFSFTLRASSLEFIQYVTAIKQRPRPKFYLLVFELLCCALSPR